MFALPINNSLSRVTSLSDLGIAEDTPEKENKLWSSILNGSKTAKTNVADFVNLFG